VGLFWTLRTNDCQDLAVVALGTLRLLMAVLAVLGLVEVGRGLLERVEMEGLAVVEAVRVAILAFPVKVDMAVVAEVLLESLAQPED